jgi:hypothetical protein
MYGIAPPSLLAAVVTPVVLLRQNTKQSTRHCLVTNRIQESKIKNETTSYANCEWENKEI